MTFERNPAPLVLAIPAAVALCLAVVFGQAVNRGDSGSQRFFSDCGGCPEMAVLPAGQFRQGDLQGSGDEDEQPVRTVTFTQAFAMARTEVTYAQWDRCVEAGRCPILDEEESDPATRDRRPVQNVSWQEAQVFIDWLTDISGQRYRLPTESEFEYGARAGTESRYAWGQTPDRTYVNYGTDECCGGGVSGDDIWMYTAPVASFPANRFGLFDMAGNVQEWVADCWGENYIGAPSDRRARGGDCDQRVLRGGSWSSTAKMIRPANRDKGLADTGLPYYGFRVARDLDRRDVQGSN